MLFFYAGTAHYASIIDLNASVKGTSAVLEVLRKQNLPPISKESIHRKCLSCCTDWYSRFFAILPWGDLWSLTHQAVHTWAPSISFWRELCTWTSWVRKTALGSGTSQLWRVEEHEDSVGASLSFLTRVTQYSQLRLCFSHRFVDWALDITHLTGLLERQGCSFYKLVTLHK